MADAFVVLMRVRTCLSVNHLIILPGPPFDQSDPLPCVKKWLAANRCDATMPHVQIVHVNNSCNFNKCFEETDYYRSCWCIANIVKTSYDSTGMPDWHCICGNELFHSESALHATEAETDFRTFRWFDDDSSWRPTCTLRWRQKKFGISVV